MIATIGWYERYAGEISFIALLLLAFMGVAVSFVRNLVNRGPAKLGFSLAFIFLAMLAWHANRTDRQEFEAKLTGSQNFAVVHSRNGQKQNDEFLTYIQGFGYIRQASLEIYNVAGDAKKISGRASQRFDIQDENMEFGLSLKAGEWELNFRSHYSNWDQTLTLIEVNGTLVQTIEVRRRGETQPTPCNLCMTMSYPIVRVPNVSR